MFLVQQIRTKSLSWKALPQKPMTFPLKWYFILVLKIFCNAYHGLVPSERYGIPKRKGCSILFVCTCVCVRGRVRRGMRYLRDIGHWGITSSPSSLLIRSHGGHILIATHQTNTNTNTSTIQKCIGGCHGGHILIDTLRTNINTSTIETRSGGC